MQTALADFIRDTPEGREADRILRAYRLITLDAQLSFPATTGRQAKEIRAETQRRGERNNGWWTGPITQGVMGFANF